MSVWARLEKDSNRTVGGLTLFARRTPRPVKPRSRDYRAHMRLPVARPVLRSQAFRDAEISITRMSKGRLNRDSITSSDAISNLRGRAVTQHVGWLLWSPTCLAGGRRLSTTERGVSAGQIEGCSERKSGFARRVCGNVKEPRDVEAAVLRFGSGAAVFV